MIHVFDIDGVLADPAHRLHLIDKDRKEGQDWDAFFLSCGDDEPIVTMCRHARNCESRWLVYYVTGRSSIAAPPTMRWLEARGLTPMAHRLRMRVPVDHRPDHVLKPVMIEPIITEHGLDQLLVYEDRSTVVKAYREMGLTVLQTAEGNF